MTAREIYYKIKAIQKEGFSVYSKDSWSLVSVRIEGDQFLIKDLYCIEMPIEPNTEDSYEWEKTETRDISDF